MVLLLMWLLLLLLVVAVLLRGRLLVAAVGWLLLIVAVLGRMAARGLLGRVIVLGLLRRLPAVATRVVTRISRHDGFGEGRGASRMGLTEILSSSDVRDTVEVVCVCLAAAVIFFRVVVGV